VLYSDTGISGGWRYVYALNPMSSVIDGFRWAVIGTHYPGGGPILFSAGVALAMLVGALYYFRRTELFFADIV